MADYKTAKEAFHADNLGSSVHHINAISIAALFAYAIYAAASRRFPSSPWLDYMTVVLPLLLAVTVLANRPWTFNLILGAIALLLSPPTRGAPRETKPAGRWLAESDSEDETTRTPARSAKRPTVKLPSELIRQNGSNPPSPAALSPDHLTPNGSPAGRRRRTSPGPAAAAVIDVAASPPASPKAPATPRAAKHSTPSVPRRTARGHLPFLTVYRAHMMVMTIHCILAVDFPVFPRELGKCEDFGTSLMDVGVGAFVFSLGIVSSRSFGRNTKGIVQTLISALRSALPVLVLGFVRLMMVKGSDYPEHMTEYGVHWNFFFTLGLVPALATALLPLRQWMKWTTAALGISTAHQLLLSLTPLQSFLLSPARPGLLGENKEGLASLPGYLAIFLVGLSAGEHVLRPRTRERDGNESDDGAPTGRSEPAESRESRRRTALALELAGYAAAAWTALGATHLLGLRVSRRFANLPYVLWVVAYNTSYLLGYLTVEITMLSQAAAPCPPLLAAINSHGLPVFLLANLLTGLVNVSIKTMYAGTTVAMLVLLAYSGAICALAWAGRGLRFKLF